MVLLVLMAASIGALTAMLVGIPGGSVLGAMLGGFLAAMVMARPIVMPEPVLTAALVVLGASIGLDLANQNFQTVWRIMPAAVGSALTVIACGIVIGLVLQQVGPTYTSPFLATSPGALTVLAGIAAEQRGAATEVAVFHLVRIVLVILSLPLLIRLMR